MKNLSLFLVFAVVSGCGADDGQGGAEGRDAPVGDVLGNAEFAVTNQNGYGWNANGIAGARCDMANPAHDCRFRHVDLQRVVFNVTDFLEFDDFGNQTDFLMLDGRNVAIGTMNTIALSGTQVTYQDDDEDVSCEIQRGQGSEFNNFTFAANVDVTPMVNAVRITCGASTPIPESQAMAGAQYCDRVVARVNPDVLKWAGRKEATADAARAREGHILEQVVGHVLARCGGLGTAASGTGEYSSNQIRYSTAGEDGTDSLTRFEKCLMNKFNDTGFSGDLTPSSGC